MPYECEFDFMCGREFATMDERDRHEREDHTWIEPDALTSEDKEDE